MFPLETIRTRLAVDPKKYRNMLGAFQTIIEAEGAGALYRVRNVHGLPFLALTHPLPGKVSKAACCPAYAWPQAEDRADVCRA